MPGFAEWFAKAAEDLLVAETTLHTLKRNCPTGLVAYHAQQAAEKALKGYLVGHGQDVPFRHDLHLLLRLCKAYGIWPERVSAAGDLTVYATQVRYPGEELDVSRKDARNAIKLARLVMDTVVQEMEMAPLGRRPRTAGKRRT